MIEFGDDDVADHAEAGVAPRNGLLRGWSLHNCLACPAENFGRMGPATLKTTGSMSSGSSAASPRQAGHTQSPPAGKCTISSRGR
jgi:hypothetical protein